jgi:hypothetical protein
VKYFRDFRASHFEYEQKKSWKVNSFF